MDDRTAVVSSSRSFFFRLAAPSVSRHLISVFPIFLFRSVSSLRPSVLVFTPSPPFLFVFRGDREPETDVRTVKNGRRCASGTGMFPSLSLPHLPLHPHIPAPNPTPKPRRRNAFYPTVPCRRVLSFCPFTIVLSDFGHRPALEPFDATRYMCSWRRKPSVLS